MNIVKGRACTARPLACLLSVTVLMLAAFPLCAPAAAVKPETPSLTGTNPPSPSTALKPFIQGKSDGSVTSGTGRSSSVLGGALPIGPVTRSENPNFVIEIYAEEPACGSEAAIVAEGTAGELEAAGIQVTVAEDSETTFYADQTDPADPTNPSACSAGLTYQQVTSPPVPPVLGSSVPAAPANDNNPFLIGTAPKRSFVDVFTTADCSGASVATGTAAVFGAGGLQVTVADNTVTTFYARSTLAGLQSACSSSSLTYREVTPVEGPGGGGGGGGGSGGGGGGAGGGGGGGLPPLSSLPNPPGKPSAPKLRVTPEGPANDNTPVLGGKAQAGTIVKIYDNGACDGAVLAQGTAAQLADGLKVAVSDNTTTAFYGVSIDGGGDRSACPGDPVVYVEDSTAPHARFTTAPGGRTRKRTVLFRFADVSGDSTAHFICRLDHHRWKTCSSPLRLGHLGHHRHHLQVKAVDSAGNAEPKGSTRAFKVIRRR